MTSGNIENRDSDKHKPDSILVKVVTTSGIYPRTGFENVKATEKVSKVLHDAAHALHLTAVNDWVAKVDTKEIDPNKTCVENHLHGEVCILWNPPEGGGGFVHA